MGCQDLGANYFDEWDGRVMEQVPMALRGVPVRVCRVSGHNMARLSCQACSVLTNHWLRACCGAWEPPGIGRRPGLYLGGPERFLH